MIGQRRGKLLCTPKYIPVIEHLCIKAILEMQETISGVGVCAEVWLGITSFRHVLRGSTHIVKRDKGQPSKQIPT
jgi:hypothetical protein